jgi:hypothetical protein
MDLYHSYPITGSATFSYARITYHESISLIRVEFTQDLLFTLKEANQLLDTCIQLTGGKSYHALSLVDVKFKVDTGVYDYLAGNVRTQWILSEAFALPTSTLRILANFYFRVKKPIILSKAFSNEGDALAWILTNNCG